jgi:integrase
MGCIYRRRATHCKTCGGKRLTRTADRKACEAAGHTTEERQSPVYWVKYTRNGKGYAESSGSDRKKDAVALLQDREGDIVRGKPVTPKMGRLTYDDAAKDLLADFTTNKKKSYSVVERRIRKHLTPFFTGQRMSNITTTLVRAYIVKRQTDLSILHRKAKPEQKRRGYNRRQPDGTKKVIPARVIPAREEERRSASNAEINRELQILQRMFALAIKAQTILYKPSIEMLDEDNVRTGFFEPEQLTSVLAHLPTEIQPVIEFAAITGWRIASEVLPLEWRQVDFDAEMVRLDPGKTKSREGREFPFTAGLRMVLQAQHAEHERLKKAGHIFPQVFFREVAEKRGGATKPQPIKSYGKVWKSACRKAGCPGRIPHDLRRTAIRNLVRTGTSETVAMQLSGHKTRSVFDRYNITSVSDLREAAKRLDAAAQGRSGSRVV